MVESRFSVLKEIFQKTDLTILDMISLSSASSIFLIRLVCFSTACFLMAVMPSRESFPWFWQPALAARGLAATADYAECSGYCI